MLLCTMLQAIDLKDCDVYSYKSDGETDPFGKYAACTQASQAMQAAEAKILQQQHLRHVLAVDSCTACLLQPRYAVQDTATWLECKLQTDTCMLGFVAAVAGLTVLSTVKSDFCRFYCSFLRLLQVRRRTCGLSTSSFTTRR